MPAALIYVVQLNIASGLFHNRQYEFDIYGNIGASGQTQQSVEIPSELKNSIIVGDGYHNRNMDHVESLPRSQVISKIHAAMLKRKEGKAPP